MDGILQRFISFTSRVGADPRYSHDLRLQKSMLVAASSMFIVTGAFWGLMYFALGEYVAGAIPIGYAVFSTLSVIAFVRFRRYHLFRFTQLLLILLLPFLLQIALGGFINSSAVILWFIVCPVGALAFSGSTSCRKRLPRS
jgi:guanylate cyclase